MVFFSPYNGGGIASCFNSTLSGAAATNPPCGFNYYLFGVGDYMIDFGFQVDDRFFAATTTSLEWTINVCTDSIGVTCGHSTLPNQVEVAEFYPVSNSYADAKFYLGVY
jgi:hypothetical protein